MNDRSNNDRQADGYVGRRRLIILDELDPDEAIQLFAALIQAPEPPETIALDHLMADEHGAEG